MTERLKAILDDVCAERARQDRIWGAPAGDPLDWYPRIGEEFGEVGQAINLVNPVNYREELIHLAAVAIAAVEAFDNEKDGAT